MAAGTGSALRETQPEPESAMGFFDHLEELRRRLLYSLVSIAVCCVLGLVFWERIYDYVSVPITTVLQQAGVDQRLVFTNPLVPLRFALQIGIYAGIFLAAPFIFWQIWLFVAPGLYRHERRFVVPFLVSSSGLFVLGAYFAQTVVLPLTLKFLVEFGSTRFEPLISVNEYFSLWLTMVLWMGVIFELPVLIFILSWMGLVTPAFLLHYFRHAILGIVVAAAIITPTTDAFTMTVFAAPMVGLYLIGIIVSWAVQLSRRRRQAKSDSQ